MTPSQQPSIAIATVAVEMGPRNTRRLARGAVGLAVVGAVMATALMNRASNPGSTLTAGSTSSPGSTSAASPSEFIHDNVPFGSTKPQVRRLLGRPTKTVGSCWQYQLNEVRPLHTINAARLCFYEGAYSQLFFKADGKWDFAPTVTGTLPSP